jgi:hypothetical protein
MTFQSGRVYVGSSIRSMRARVMANRLRLRRIYGEDDYVVQVRFYSLPRRVQEQRSRRTRRGRRLEQFILNEYGGSGRGQGTLDRMNVIRAK